LQGKFPLFSVDCLKDDLLTLPLNPLIIDFRALTEKGIIAAAMAVRFCNFMPKYR